MCASPSRAQRRSFPKRVKSGAICAGDFAWLFDKLKERLDDIDGHREDDSGVLLGADFGQGLQISELHGGRDARKYLGGVDEGL